MAYSAEQFMENKEIKNKNISKKKKFCYKFSLFIITSIYLVGSFIIVSLKKSFWNFLLNSLKCKFDVYCEKGEFMKQLKNIKVSNRLLYLHVSGSYP